MVVRTSYSSQMIRVNAKDKKEAKEKALDEAGNYEFPEKDADYDVDFIINRDEVKAVGKAMAKEVKK